MNDKIIMIAYDIGISPFISILEELILNKTVNKQIELYFVI